MKKNIKKFGFVLPDLQFILTFRYKSVKSRVFLKHLRAFVPCLSLV